MIYESRRYECRAAEVAGDDGEDVAPLTFENTECSSSAHGR